MTDSCKTSVKLPFPAAELIIHRPPMLLIDSLTEREGDTAAATAKIDADSICFSSDRKILPEYFIEIMAQTMAAANGYDALLQQTTPQDGFIVGLDLFTLHQLPQDSDEFTIRIIKKMEFGSMKVMEGEVLADSTSIASVELKVWEQPKDEK